MRKTFGAAIAAAAFLVVAPAGHGQTTIATGKVQVAQGHELPACRMVMLNTTSGNLWFRIPGSTSETGILAVALTALTTGLTVNITYDPTQTSGCGSEPKIAFIAINAAP